nr:MAG TPA: hypothetical protein [Caudoviricetes sp.]
MLLNCQHLLVKRVELFFSFRHAIALCGTV